MKGVASRSSVHHKIERVTSIRVNGLVTVDKVESIINRALDTTSNYLDAAEAVPKADRYVPTESGLVDLSHVAAAIKVPLGMGPALGDLREKQDDSYSSGMQEDYNAHDAARAAAGADNAGAAAAKYIQTLGPLSEREALKGMQP